MWQEGLGLWPSTCRDTMPGRSDRDSVTNRHGVISDDKLCTHYNLIIKLIHYSLISNYYKKMYNSNHSCMFCDLMLNNQNSHGNFRRLHEKLIVCHHLLMDYFFYRVFCHILFPTHNHFFYLFCSEITQFVINFQHNFYPMNHFVTIF